jgi:hypothetical protein
MIYVVCGRFLDALFVAKYFAERKESLFASIMAMDPASTSPAEMVEEFLHGTDRQTMQKTGQTCFNFHLKFAWPIWFILLEHARNSFAWPDSSSSDLFLGQGAEGLILFLANLQCPSHHPCPKSWAV